MNPLEEALAGPGKIIYDAYTTATSSHRVPGWKFLRQDFKDAWTYAAMLLLKHANPRMVAAANAEREARIAEEKLFALRVSLAASAPWSAVVMNDFGFQDSRDPREWPMHYADAVLAAMQKSRPVSEGEDHAG
jgi:hypothetical protein